MYWRMLPFKTSVGGKGINEGSNGNRCMSAIGNAIGGIRRICMNLTAMWRGSAGPGPKIPSWVLMGGKPRGLQHIYTQQYKSLANAKRLCDCRVLCLRQKSSLCSCPHYGCTVLFTGEFYRLTERIVISMHVDATTG